MKKLIKIVFLVLLVSIVNPFDAFAEKNLAIDITANDSDTKANAQFDWNQVMNAIVQVESNGNSHAKHGNSVGAMQITPILVLQCNQILKRRKSKKRFRLSDRFNIAKSKEMFMIFQSFYTPLNNIELAIRSWNGGMHYSIERTQKYFERVMNFIK